MTNRDRSAALDDPLNFMLGSPVET
jgi:hypothetical protein